MLTQGFKSRIYGVFQLLPQDTQVVLLSTTMPADVLEATKKLVREPVRIIVKRVELTSGDIKQFYITVEKEEWKLDTLCDLYEMVTVRQAVTFCNTRRKVDWLTEKMHLREFTVSAMVRSLRYPRVFGKGVDCFAYITARRHGSEAAGGFDEGTSFWFFARLDHHRSTSSQHGRAAHNQLRLAHKPGELHSPYWPWRSIRTEGSRH